MALWNAGLDFRHGTGHGVGHFLNVHEGPAGIGYRSISFAKEGIVENMVLTIGNYYNLCLSLSICVFGL
jgi:Xaa-Pro aminopeptidase